jgi:pilus assembly protein FimV
MIHVIWQINNDYNFKSTLPSRVVPLTCSVFRFSLPVLLLSLSGVVSAVGLGDLRGNPVLGESLRLEITLLGAPKESLDANCFRVVPPSDAGDLPWLKKASISVRRSTPPILEIFSEIPLREPVLQLALKVTCGVEMSREYVLLASPRMEVIKPVVEPRLVPEISRPIAPVMPSSRQRRPVQQMAVEAPRRLKPRRSEGRPAAVPMPDRLMLSGGMDGGEPSLRLATELLSWRGVEAKEVQREILRLEYRMIAALNEQVTTQMATAEKLRNMESTLSELQQRTTDFAQRVEGKASSVVPPGLSENAVPVAKPQVPIQPSPEIDSSGISEWSFYGVVLGALLGVGGWLGWRKYRARRQVDFDDDFQLESSDLDIDPVRGDEREELGGVALRVEPAVMGMPMAVDVHLADGEQNSAGDENAPANSTPVSFDSLMSISSTTVDEHFEANPVMELADIMLSFGRVKGAAQALQEYIDNNPQEALQPWIRLMDVYRMAGMKSEFETVAANLNQNFNVEVQQWQDAQLVDGENAAAPSSESVPVAPRPESLEDMPRIMAMVCELWPTGDIVGYLYQLLRDNRGGQRVGFALPVVEEILFLIELKETSNRIE